LDVAFQYLNGNTAAGSDEVGASPEYRLAPVDPPNFSRKLLTNGLAGVGLEAVDELG
jgi:hypothetical protein